MHVTEFNAWYRRIKDGTQLNAVGHLAVSTRRMCQLCKLVFTNLLHDSDVSSLRHPEMD
jgi:primosomal replication protein N